RFGHGQSHQIVGGQVGVEVRDVAGLAGLAGLEGRADRLGGDGLVGQSGDRVGQVAGLGRPAQAQFVVGACHSAHPIRSAMSAMVHGPSVSTGSPPCQPISSVMAPPWTAKTLPVTAQSGAARRTTSGEMLAGSKGSNSPSGTSAANRALIPGVARVSRVR